MDEMSLDGKVALVTGGARGIGRAICLALAGAGAGVAVNYRSSEAEAADLVRQIEMAGGKAVALAGDVGDPADMASVAARATADLGGLHILVNNAGIVKDGLIFTMEPADWQSVMNVNFGGVFNATKAVLRHFMGQREGTIINISSVMSERGWTGQANYSASKGAINAFTRSAAVELARFGIRVNAVLPGFAPTEMTSALIDKDGKGITQQLPLRRFASVADVAALTVFLAGPDSAYITGACLPVDGGGTAQFGLGRPA
ncbi:MAG TPA: 3-oxoacyl-ACP reductase family protein [Trebonia sp.]